MSTFDQLVNECYQTLQGYGLDQPRAAFLQSSVTSDALTFTVADAEGFSQGIAEIENEIVFIDSVDYGSGIITVAPDGRGWYGSTAAAHASSTRITMAPVWPKARIAGALNEAIVSTYPLLFGVASTSFNYNPSVTTYSLPATADAILRVEADTIGPSEEQLEIKRYRFNSAAAADQFATGKSITLEKGAFPGRKVYVTYATEPTEITFGDTFTESGLAESAKLCVKYSALSALTAPMDASRLPVDTAQADEYDSKAGIGTATRTSAQLYQRYLMELENERKRLRTAYPVTIKVRSR